MKQDYMVRFKELFGIENLQIFLDEFQGETLYIPKRQSRTVYHSTKERDLNIYEMYVMKAFPVNILAKMFDLSESRIRDIVSKVRRERKPDKG